MLSGTDRANAVQKGGGAAAQAGSEARYRPMARTGNHACSQCNVDQECGLVVYAFAGSARAMTRTDRACGGARHSHRPRPEPDRVDARVLARRHGARADPCQVWRRSRRHGRSGTDADELRLCRCQVGGFLLVR
eukprot:3028078-Rhodomonas_salina.2